MSKRITTIDEASSLTLPPDAVEALGVKAGEDLDVEVVGRAVIVRSVEEGRRSREFLDSFESILQRRRQAYEKLAEGPER
jgi:antitoxin component of MazEF toxin-antitoxin module